MTASEWSSIQIRSNLADGIKDIINRQADPSITNSSQFIDLAIRRFIENQESQDGT